MADQSKQPSGKPSKASDSLEPKGEAASCNVCRGTKLTEFADYRRFRRVASDCRPWPAGGRVQVCQHCGCVLKLADEHFLADIKKIYSSYEIYHQSNGMEQAVFEAASGTGASRSNRMLAELRARHTLAPQGRMLDIGCGNGVMLRAFNAASPQWTLAGAELNERYRPIVEAIPKVERLYSCPPPEIPGQFNIITMVHSLEHIIGPIDFLKGVRGKLAPGGLLVVQVPNLPANPFEIIVADHTSHFTLSSLRGLIEQAGYEVLHISDAWVHKELSVIARVSDKPIAPVPADPAEVERSTQVVRNNLRWLGETVAAAKALTQQGKAGLFGTSIAATWLAAELEGLGEFFVDEDPSRPGKPFMMRPVFAPAQVPAGSKVFVGLPPKVAAGIAQRLSRPGVEYVTPPKLD